MKHDTLRHKLSEYLDGAVTGKDKAAIEEHLKSCTQCSDALAELRKTIQLVKEIDEVNPPSWMTQKIMAKVRAEAGEKKGLFQRLLLYPLSIKLPIQAVAVLFLAVTAFFVYQNIQPTAEFATAPFEQPAKQETPPSGIARDKLAKTNDTSLRSKQVPQSLEYKALDMKQEYESPPPPVLEDRAAAPAPAPAKRGTALEKRAVPAPASEQMQESTSDKFFAASKVQEEAKKQGLTKSQETPASAGAREKAAESQGFAARGEVTREARPQAAKAKAAASTEKEGPPADITVTAEDLASAEKKIEKALARSGGKIVKRELLANKKIFTATIAAKRLKELAENLKSAGDVTENRPSPVNGDSMVTIKLELIQR